VRDDLRALGSVSEREAPALERTMQQARLRQERGPASWREKLMSGIRIFERRPWLASAAAAVVMALILVAVPVSYQRTTGHEVRLALGAAALGAAQVSAIARELGAVLGAKSVQAWNQDGRLELRAFVPAGSRRAAGATANAFARQLAAKGYGASATTRVVRERVSGSVYAFARDQVITIRTDGMSAAELEAEIRRRFAEAGVPDAEVSVTDAGEGRREVKLKVNRDGEAGSAGAHDPIPGLVLTKEGAPLAGEGFEIKVMKRKSAAGVSLVVEVQDGSRSATATVAHPDALGDAAVAAEIERQLAAAGIRARVTVSGEQVEVEKL
jgi:hypothetical protein